MPRKKTLSDYVREFYHDVLKNKYGPKSITPEIFQVEILKYIKKLDPEFAINNIVEFINNCAADVSDVQGTDGLYLSADRNLNPYEFFGNLLVNYIPSQKVFDAMSSNMSKTAYINYCNKLRDSEGKGSKENVIEYKMNKFKILEALKPKSNKVTGFFKKLFNIGGYNEKLAAYESCKQSIRELVGDRLTNEEFESQIRDAHRFYSISLKKEKAINAKRIDVSKDVVDVKENVPIEIKTENINEKEVIIEPLNKK